MDVNHMMITFSGIQTDVIDRLKELATKLGEDHATIQAAAQLRTETKQAWCK